MLGIALGGPEILIIVLVVLLLFGSTQLPKLARSIGQASNELKRGIAEGTDEDAPADEATPADEADDAASAGAGAESAP